MQIINNDVAKIGHQVNVMGGLPSELPVLLNFGKKDCKYKVTYLDREYVTIMNKIITDGFIYEDPNRKGVKRKQIPFATISASGRGVFEDGVISIRKSYFKGAVAELLLFLRGETDVRKYEEWGVRFWTKDVDNFAKRNGITHDGQLQAFEKFKETVKTMEWFIKDEAATKNCYIAKRYDMGKIYPYQYKKQYHVFDNFKSNPYRTDLIVNSWNVDDLKDMCLPPCHHIYQFVKTQDGFGIVWSQRSVDFLLGTSLNLTFYWLMGKILEIWSGHKFEFVRGELHNVHLYDNQFELADKIIEVGRNANTVHAEHKVEIDSSTWGLDLPFEEFIKTVKPEHFKLKNYKPILKETVEMLAYDK